MTKKTLTRGLAALVLGLAVQACSGDAVAPPAADTQPLFNVTTTPPMTKTATPVWQRLTTYDWTLEKSVTPATLALGPGQSGTFNYTITVNRGEPTVVDAYGVTGQICITNTSSNAAQLTSLLDQFYSYDGSTFVLLQSTAVDYSSNPVLDPGEQGCYPYAFTLPAGFTPNASLQYKNRGVVTAVAVGGTTSATAQTDYVQVVWPQAPTSEEVIDETATLYDDTYVCPPGFTCDFSAGTWSFSDDGQQTFGVLVTNLTAACGSTFDFLNSARLFEDDTQTRHDDDAPSTVTTPACQVSGCTPGFWQGGAGGRLWNVAADPQWDGALAQPYHWGTSFNGFFTPHANLNGQTMLMVISNGGTSDPVNKAARSLVAAYLNASYAGYPYTQAQLKTMWTNALAGGAAALLGLHTDLDWQNNNFDCRD